VVGEEEDEDDGLLGVFEMGWKEMWGKACNGLVRLGFKREKGRYEKGNRRDGRRVHRRSGMLRGGEEWEERGGLRMCQIMAAAAVHVVISDLKTQKAYIYMEKDLNCLNYFFIVFFFFI